jgi:hypothetical protein
MRIDGGGGRCAASTQEPDAPTALSPDVDGRTVTPRAVECAFAKAFVPRYIADSRQRK